MEKKILIYMGAICFLFSCMGRDTKPGILQHAKKDTFPIPRVYHYSYTETSKERYCQGYAQNWVELNYKPTDEDIVQLVKSSSFPPCGGAKDVVIVVGEITEFRTMEEFKAWFYK